MITSEVYYLTTKKVRQGMRSFPALDRLDYMFQPFFPVSIHWKREIPREGMSSPPQSILGDPRD